MRDQGVMENSKQRRRQAAMKSGEAAKGLGEKRELSISLGGAEIVGSDVYS